MAYHTLLHPLDWHACAATFDPTPRPGKPPADRACFIATYLVKLHEQKRYMSDVRAFLVKHPALVWLLGFPLKRDATASHGFNPETTVPTRRHLSHVLRMLPNDACQSLLNSSIRCIQQALPTTRQDDFAQTVSGDTKHIIAWVKENNPKAYVKQRFDKTRQPNGDRDCKLGVKRRRNKTSAADQGQETKTFPTPTTDAKPATNARHEKEAYWGYASGVIVTILPDKLGEVVLAERTRPFNESDLRYFFPLMERTEQNLGFRPRNGTFDAGFDAFYVYDYFAQAGGIAAVPLVAKGGTAQRCFTPDGVPRCKAGLPMGLGFTYADRTSTLVPHERAKYGCPLRNPALDIALPCPIDDPRWDTGGCTTTIATSAGARLRIELDRTSDDYKAIYKQRTATERINSQAKEWGIERPKLRNGQSITNLNTLISVLINLHTMHRIRDAQSAAACQEVAPAPTDE
jgi:hypothetical protein